MLDPDTLSARVSELESRYTLEHEMLQQLSDVVFAQQKEIAGLAVRISALERRLSAAAAQPEPRDPDDELPPHY